MADGISKTYAIIIDSNVDLDLDGTHSEIHSSRLVSQLKHAGAEEVTLLTLEENPPPHSLMLSEENLEKVLSGLKDKKIDEDDRIVFVLEGKNNQSGKCIQTKSECLPSQKVFDLIKSNLAGIPYERAKFFYSYANRNTRSLGREIRNFELKELYPLNPGVLDDFLKRDLRYFESEIQSGDPARIKAALILFNANGPYVKEPEAERFVTKLVDLLKSKDPQISMDIKEAVAVALSKIGFKTFSALPVFIEILSSEKNLIREVIFLQLLRKMIEKNNESKFLDPLQATELLNLILTKLDSKKPLRVQQEAFEFIAVLSYKIPNLAKTQQASKLQEALDRLLKSENISARELVAGAAHAFPDYETALRRNLESLKKETDGQIIATLLMSIEVEWIDFFSFPFNQKKQERTKQYQAPLLTLLIPLIKNPKQSSIVRQKAILLLGNMSELAEPALPLLKSLELDPEVKKDSMLSFHVSNSIRKINEGKLRSELRQKK